ncbi:MAG: HK97-gp10 family putative phage morphogenesis protein [Candidatus Heimdallarchaeaceae archaeon]
MKVIGTHGKVVDVQLLGVGEVMRRLRMAGKEIESSAEVGIVKAGAFVEEEVKESVMGNRAEPRSVDTGHFVNDIKAEKIGKEQMKIHAPNTPYAKFLEYGTSKMVARSHFRNTKIRNQKKVKDIVGKEIKIGVI